MRLDRDDLTQLINKPTPASPPPATASGMPKQPSGAAVDLPNFSPPVVYADESLMSPDETVVDSNEYDGYGYEEEQAAVATDDRYWQPPPLLSLAQDLLGIGAVWTAIGWTCSLPFVGHALYFLLMAPITVGALAIAYLFYLLYFRGITRSRLESAFQVLAMHSIIHDCCSFWFSGFPR